MWTIRKELCSGLLPQIRAVQLGDGQYIQPCLQIVLCFAWLLFLFAEVHNVTPRLANVKSKQPSLFRNLPLEEQTVGTTTWLG